MRKAVVLIIVAFLVLIFVGGVVLQSTAILQRIAAVRDVQGDVRIKSRNGNRFTPLADTPRVQAGDSLKTGRDGSVTLEWLDGTRLVVEPNTALTVLKCHVNRADSSEVSQFRLDIGTIWVRVIKSLSSESQFEIETPTATAAVRGTVFAVRVGGDGRTHVSVLEGAVELGGDAEAARIEENSVAVVAGRQTLVADFDETESEKWAAQETVAGPILRMREPEGGYMATPGSPLTIRGWSEMGATVTVNGTPAPLGAKHAFKTDLVVPSDFDGEEYRVEVKAVDARGYETLRELAVAVSR